MKEIEEGIFLKDSGVEGNVTTIMVGVHGNEKSGIEALDEIINDIKIIKGKVYFIYANLEAIDKNVRLTERNLNRSFYKGNNGTTYEDKRARQIMKYLDKSDYLLDIHNTIGEVNSISFIITEHEEFGKYFNVDKMISGFDELQVGGSDGYMNTIGKRSVCIECGSIYYGNKEKAKDLAKDSIYNFLSYAGNVKNELREYKNKEMIKFDFMYSTETIYYKPVKLFKDFEFLKKGDLIAYDGEKIIKADIDGYILFSYKPNKIGEEAFCFGTKK